MNTAPLVSHPTRWFGPLVAGLLALAGLVACGGGVGEGGTGGQTVSGYGQGTISGFGSIIVNGVRYDDSAATVLDVDGSGKSSADLRLGMTVEVDSGEISGSVGSQTATASRIRYSSEMVGPLTGVDAIRQRLTLLGQTVQLTASTVFDDSLVGGLSALSVGRVVEVHAAYDTAAAVYKATRVEPRANATSYRLRGVVSQLNTGASSFRIGAAEFSYAGVGSVPSTLANGSFVRVQLALAAANSSRWTVTTFGSAGNEVVDGRKAKFKGLVTAYSSVADFSVNGQRVNASGASFSGGSAANLTAGLRLEAEGVVQSGVLVASKVSVDSRGDDDPREFELKGNIASLDTLNKRFTLRGVVVSYASTGVAFKSGTVADLAVNRKVEVKGVLSSDGNTVLASEIEFD
jgi:hypothetical protein